jgi:hypothetical protein
MSNVLGAGSLAFSYIFHTHVLKTYLSEGAIYLPEKTIRYGILQMKLNACISIHPIKNKF